MTNTEPRNDMERVFGRPVARATAEDSLSRRLSTAYAKHPMTRRVRNFDGRAQAMLEADGMAGAQITLYPSGELWLFHDGCARVSLWLDPYDLASADPATVRERAIKGLRQQARNQRYTDASRADDARFADLLEESTR